MLCVADFSYFQVEVLRMFENAKRFLWQFLARAFGNESEKGEPPDDRDAGIPVRVRRGPPDRGSAVAVAEPDDE
jgi:hypothetical protein